MHYWIFLTTKSGATVQFKDQILPGVVPDHVLDLMEAMFVEKELKLCKLCDVQGRRCHVIDEATGRKLCPVLFVDAVKPPWTVQEVA
jgi:hypothetical protein